MDLKSRSFLASRSFFWIEACCAFSFAAASSKAWSCFCNSEKRPRVVGGSSGTASGNCPAGLGAGAGAPAPRQPGRAPARPTIGAATGGRWNVDWRGDDSAVDRLARRRGGRPASGSRATAWRGGGDGGSASRRVDATGLPSASSTKKSRADGACPALHWAAQCSVLSSQLESCHSSGLPERCAPMQRLNELFDAQPARQRVHTNRGALTCQKLPEPDTARTRARRLRAHRRAVDARRTSRTEANSKS